MTESRTSTIDLWGEVIPALYQRADEAFPEFGFVRRGKGWQSTTAVKIDGNVGDKAGKVYLYENNPGRLIDYTREPVSVWDYIQSRDNLTNGQVFRKLADLAGCKLLTRDLTPQEAARLEEERGQARLYECLNDFFIDCLSGPENENAQSNQAAVLRKYLTENRGYKPSYFRKPGQDADHQSAQMELGFVPHRDKVRAHLISKGFSEKEAFGVMAEERLGKSHILSIPFRDSVGRIKGMIYRSIHGENPKYLYSGGLDKSGLLFNLKAVRGDKELLFVEGQLDALHASAIGIENVVALGGSSLNERQIQAAIKAGAKSITLIPDNDEAGRNAALKWITALQKHDLKVYVAEVPKEARGAKIKDLDQFIRVMGESAVDATRQLIREAFDIHSFRLSLLIHKYWPDGEGYLSIKQHDSFLSDVVELASQIEKPLEREHFVKDFLAQDYIKALEISKEAFDATIDQIRYKKSREKQEFELKALLGKVDQLRMKGDSAAALDLITSKARDIKAIDQETAFSGLLVPTNEQEVIARLQVKPQSLKTSFNIQRHALEVPAGAISIVAAPTNHGKTTLLINLGLDLAESHPGKEFHFFSYEESRDAILIKSLNASIGKDVAPNNRKAIEAYFRTGTLANDLDRAIFNTGKDRFFRFIDSRRFNIHYVNYDADTLANAIRYLAKQPNTGGVLIDYMQLLSLPGGKYKTYSRQEEVKQICLILKDAAVETGLPVIVAAQFNREVTNLTKIHATKIGEAGDIERIAAMILGVWNNNKKPFGLSEDDEEMIAKEGKCEEGTLYTTLLKSRDTETDIWDLWDFKGNAGKVSSRPAMGGNGFESKYNF